jgi:serine/threonine protein kinase
MVSDEGQPILMDFGSALVARIPITSRSIALREQDRAAEHSTMPYRAPELFDVKTDQTLDEKVDIWSLGCTLYAMAYGTSPFETNQTEQGGSIACVARRFAPQHFLTRGQTRRYEWVVQVSSQRPGLQPGYKGSDRLHATNGSGQAAGYSCRYPEDAGLFARAGMTGGLCNFRIE